MAWDACGGAHLDSAGGLWDLDLLRIEAIPGLRWLARPRKSVVDGRRLGASERRSWEHSPWIRSWVLGGLEVALRGTEISTP